MTIKNIITEPNKILRQISNPVQKVGKDERKIMDDMLETMYAANGIGLAAIQIGIPKRIIVIDLKIENKKNPFYFVNPVIKNKDNLKSTYEEGCLSVPNQFAQIDRPKMWCRIFKLWGWKENIKSRRFASYMYSAWDGSLRRNTLHRLFIKIKKIYDSQKTIKK